MIFYVHKERDEKLIREKSTLVLLALSHRIKLVAVYKSKFCIVLIFFQHETSSFHEVSPSSRDLNPESNVMEEMSMPPPPPLQAAAAFQGRRHFKRRLRMEKTKKESLFNDLQAVAVSKNVSEKIKNDILLENLEKVKEDRLFVEAQRERQTSFERAQREIQLDILKLERKTKEAILKKIQSGNCFSYYYLHC